MSQSLCVYGVFKTPGNLKKKKCGCCFRVPCGNTDKGHKRVGVLEFRKVATDHLWWCLCGVKSMHGDLMANKKHGVTCKTFTDKAITALLVRYVTNVNFPLLIVEL